jgi:hypothetical protein
LKKNFISCISFIFSTYLNTRIYRLNSSNYLELIDSVQDNNLAVINSFQDIVLLTNNEFSSSSASQNDGIHRKRHRFLAPISDTETNRKYDPERTETIHKALAKLISMNQLPLSFCSSSGFRQFMAVVESNYKIFKEEALKKR